MSSYQSNMANVQICVTAGKGDRTGKEPLRSNPVPFCCILSGKKSTYFYSGTPALTPLRAEMRTRGSTVLSWRCACVKVNVRSYQ